MRNAAPVRWSIVVLVGAIVVLSGQSGVAKSMYRSGHGTATDNTHFGLELQNQTYPSNATVVCGACTAPPGFGPMVSNGTGGAASGNSSTSQSGNGSSILSSCGYFCTCNPPGCHYYYGAEFAGTSRTTTILWTTISTPASGPRYGDGYYVLLSAFDTNWNYDQFGFESDWGSTVQGYGAPSQDWQLVWVAAPTSQTTCASTFNVGSTWQPNALTMNPLSVYTFEMALGGGKLTFSLYYGTGLGGYLVWSHSISDTASGLKEAPGQVCGGNTLSGYTDYEEVYSTTVGMFPTWNFNFTANHDSSGAVTQWTRMAAAGNYPRTWHGYEVMLLSGQQWVSIANEAYTLGLSYNFQYVTRGTYYSDPGNINKAGDWCGLFYCYDVLSCSFPSGWTWSYGWYYLVPSPVTVDWTVSSSAPLNTWFYFGCSATIASSNGGSPYELTNYILYMYT